MSFNAYKPFKKRNLFPKFAIVFLLGISFAVFFSNATTIVAWITNATQYIKQIVLTTDWTSNWTTGVVLNWSNWKIWATYLCDSNLNNCILIQSLWGAGTETDPVFSNSASSLITSLNVSNRNSAFARWNHATRWYLTWYTETDPQVWVTTSWQRCVWNGSQVTCTQAAPAWWTADNLWDHTATEDIKLGSHYINYSWATSEWLRILPNNNVSISNMLEVACWSSWLNKWIRVWDNSWIYDDNCSAIPADTLHLESNDSVAIRSNSLYGIFVNTNWKVWIWGSAIPSYSLDVINTGRFQKDLYVVGNLWLWTTTPGSYKLNVNWSGYIAWNSYFNGNVGIWKAPSSNIKLDVAGNIKLSQWNTTCDISSAWEIKYDWCFRWCNWSWWTSLWNCNGWVCWSYHNQNYYTIPGNGNCAAWSTLSAFTIQTVPDWVDKRTRQCTANSQVAYCSANQSINGVCNNAVINACTAGYMINDYCDPDTHKTFRECSSYNWWLTNDMCFKSVTNCP